MFFANYTDKNSLSDFVIFMKLFVSQEINMLFTYKIYFFGKIVL